MQLYVQTSVKRAPDRKNFFRLPSNLRQICTLCARARLAAQRAGEPRGDGDGVGDRSEQQRAVIPIYLYFYWSLEVVVIDVVIFICGKGECLYDVLVK